MLREAGSIPGSGRSPGGGRGNPLQYSCLENSMDRGASAGYSLWGRKESDTTNTPTLKKITEEVSESRDDLIHQCYSRSKSRRGLPSGSVVKYLPANAGDPRDMGSIPGSGRSSGGGNGNPLQYSCLRNMDRGAWQVTVLGSQKSQMQLSDWATVKAQRQIRFGLIPTCSSLRKSSPCYTPVCPYENKLEYRISLLKMMQRKLQLEMIKQWVKY